MHQPPPVTRHSLLVKLRDPADSAAWGEFLAIYEPLVYRLGRLKGLQDADAKIFARRSSMRWPGPLTAGSRARQLSLLALADRTQSADQLSHAKAVSALGKRGFQHTRPAGSSAGQGRLGHGPLRGRA